MVIIKSSNARAVAALLDARPASDPAVQRRVAAIVARVRREGDAALLRYARRFDGLEGPIEVTRREIEKSATLVDANVKKAIALAAKNIRAVAEKQRPRPWTVTTGAGRHDPSARAAARSRWLLRSRRALSAAFLAADDRDSGARGRRAGSHRGVPETRPDRHVRGARGGGVAAVPPRRRARYRCAGLRHGTSAARRSHRRAGKRLRRRGEGARLAATARSISSPDRARLRCSRRPESRRGSRRTSSRRPSTIRMRARF